MNNSNFVKDIYEKIKLWLINLFRKKKIVIKKQQDLKEMNKQKTNTKKKYKINFTLNEEDKSTTIGTIYPKLSKENLQLLNKKSKLLKDKVQNLNPKNKTGLNNIDEIIKKINEGELEIDKAIEISNLLNDFTSDEQLHLNTNEKINLLKDNISVIIDKKLDNYENDIIKKAYKEYNDVNYVIMTTLLIDDIIDEISELNDDYRKNKYTKEEYERKINKIKDKINKLETIHKRKEVQIELERLRKDFYTKKKDKYDLLYSEEIFVNLNGKCDELLTIIKENEKKEIEKKEISKAKKEEENKEKKKKTEEEKDLKKKKEEKEKQKKEFNENVLKRFIDIEFAHKLLLLRESKRKKLITRDEIINETLSYYHDFLIGENHEFNFERNRLKTEVAKLYNDINSTICAIEKREFTPLEHINIKLDLLTEATLENQILLNDMLEKKHHYRMEEHETSKNVTDKLNGILVKEKAKEKTDEKGEKVLKKEYKPPQKEDNSNH